MGFLSQKQKIQTKKKGRRIRLWLDPLQKLIDPAFTEDDDLEQQENEQDKIPIESTLRRSQRQSKGVPPIRYGE